MPTGRPTQSGARLRACPRCPRGRGGPTGVQARRRWRGGRARSCSSSHSTRPGSIEPDRVAITRPSSGVKPMVVSTLRPSTTAASDAPAPRWQLTIRSSSAATPDEFGCAAHAVRVREAVEAVAADAVLRRATRAARRTSTPRRAACVKGRVEARNRWHVRAVRDDRVERGEGLRLVQRRQVGELSQRGGDRRRRCASAARIACRRARSGDRRRRRAGGPPHPVQRRGELAVGQVIDRAEILAGQHRVVVVEQPELQAARPGVDGEDAAWSVRPGPVGDRRDRPRRARGCRRGRRGAGPPSAAATRPRRRRGRAPGR